MLPLSLSAISLGAFLLITSALGWVCRQQLRNPRCHGFYRFFAFVGIAWLLVHALAWWHYQLISLRQIVSLLLLCVSLGLLCGSLRQLLHRGSAGSEQRGAAQRENFAFENTERLVTSGIYRYIRHPMYSSLLFLALGILLKRPALDSLIVCALVAAMLYVTARIEERENCEFFGADYQRYQQRSKMFIPALW